MVRDGDPEGAKSTEQLWRGVVHLIVEGHQMKMTPRPSTLYPGKPAPKDVNDVLVTHGVDGVQTLLSAAASAPVPDIDHNAAVSAVARLDQETLSFTRGQLAGALGIGVVQLDAAIRSNRKRAAEAAGENEEDL